MSKTYEQLEPVISALDKRIKTNLEAYPTDTAAGPIASFPDGADNAPLKSLVVGINPVQSGKDDPSPTNVRPIIGHTQVNVTMARINIWDEEWDKGYVDTADGIFLLYPKYVRSKHKFSIKGGEKYYFACSRTGTLGNAGISFYDENGDFISSIVIHINGVFTVPDKAKMMAFFAPSDWYTGDYTNDISINYPSTDTEYHPYSGESIDISFPTEAGTVYGGTLDVLTGVLTVTKGFIQSYNGEILPSTWISDRDVYAEGTTPTTGAEVCYDLATPITYQLTPHEVKSLLGSNNIWADTGDTSLEYRADTTKYINRKIAEAISALS